MTITLQAIHTGTADVIDERTANSPAGARRSLLAMIERTAPSWPDELSVQHAEAQAAAWDGDSPISLLVQSQNRSGSTTITAGR